MQSSSTLPGPWLIPLDAPKAELSTAGGKGANLARLARAGYPVPGGFLVTADAYRAYVDGSALAPRIQAALQGLDPNDPACLDQVSALIRALFTVEFMPPGLRADLCAAYRVLGQPAVAVRSSATAEDLPEMSFAGQQDTYLNVLGEAALLQAVAACWGSLWTARAIGYRARQGVSPDGLALAVVVQEMVQSQASGVLFTANPLTGARDEYVIDATIGLGEALVSGQVEPDHYLVDARAGAIREKKLGRKALSIRARAGGGVETLGEDAAALQALPDEAILALAELGRRVTAEYGQPQDIEWAWAGEKLYLLQSRAVTSLFPIPQGIDPADLRVFFSFAAVQGLLTPITPLGRDVLALIFAGGGQLFGMQMDERSQRVLRTAGERLWVDITTLVRNPVGRKTVRIALSFIEPSAGQNLDRVWQDPRLVPTDRRLKFSTAVTLARFLAPLFIRVIQFWASPDQRIARVRARTGEVIGEYQRALDAAAGSREEKLAARVANTRALTNIFKLMAFHFLPAIAGSMSMWNLINHQAAALDREQGSGETCATLALEITRGVPNNVTTEMDLALWETARAIRSDPQAAALFLSCPAADLAHDYLQGSLPDALQRPVGAFMQRYGLRGLGEIDMGSPRWCEEPTHIFQVLGSYLQIEDERMAPDRVFARGEQAGRDAVQQLAERARRARGGWFRSRLIRFAGRRVRALIGMREAPKFYAISISGINRLALLQSGQEYAQAGIIDVPEDLFFLTMRELEALSRGELENPRALVTARRAAQEREKLRRQIPRLLLSDGRAFYEGMAAPAGSDGSGLHGEPVSPGVVEGIVRVVLDPRGVRLQPGEILVCPGTDPSWTPLFLAAGGLVMEVGGLMTHGAVVAREYGIPAVVGVHQVTSRLETGARVRVNGSTGEITLL